MPGDSGSVQPRRQTGRGKTPGVFNVETEKREVFSEETLDLDRTFSPPASLAFLSFFFCPGYNTCAEFVL